MPALTKKPTDGFSWTPAQPGAVDLDDAVRNLDLVLPDAHRRVGPDLAVEADEVAEVDAGQDVAVDDEDRLLQLLDQAQPAARPERDAPPET